MKTVSESLNWRYATKKFDEAKKISSDQLNSIIEAVRMAPTSYGLQPFRLVVVEDKNVREQLKEVSWGQSQITDSSHLLVFAVLKKIGEVEVNNYINLIAKERNVPLVDLDGFKQMILNSANSLDDQQRMEWAKRQAYIGLGAGILSASEMGVDSCPMEGFVPAEYDRILGLEEKNLTATVLLALGFRREDDEYSRLKKVRLPISEFVK